MVLYQITDLHNLRFDLHNRDISFCWSISNNALNILRNGALKFCLKCIVTTEILHFIQTME